MPRKRKKKSILQGIRETIHSLTKPKRTRKKVKRRKAPTIKQVTGSTQDPQENLEQKLTKKMSDELQRMKQQMQEELLEKLSQQNIKENRAADNVGKGIKKEPAGKKNHSANSDKREYKPQSDCSFLKTLILTDSRDAEVVVGYEVLDNNSQEVWGIGIHEGARLGRSKRILNTKVRSRTVDSERQYYLANEQDDTLYFSENYKKTALLNGKINVDKYTSGLIDAIKQAHKAGYRSNSKMPKM